MFAPVLELVFVDLDVDLHDARLQALLDIGDRLVVDDGARLLEKIAEQRAGGDAADRLFHVFAKVAFDGSDRYRAGSAQPFLRPAAAIASR